MRTAVTRRPTPRPPARPLLAALVALPLLLAGCGDEGGGGGDDGDQAASPAPASSGPPGASAPAPDGSDPVAPGGKGPTELRGTVQPGVEAGCLVLDSGGTTWLLLGAVTPDLVGREVVLTGAPAAADTVSTCQQGTAFQVTAVQ